MDLARSVRDHNLNLQARLYRRLLPRYSRRMALEPDIEITAERYGTAGTGYVVWADGLSKESVVYSFGVGATISFELALIEAHGLTVHAFDPTEESRAFVDGQELPQRFHFHPWALSGTDGEAALASMRTWASPSYLPATLLDVGEDGPTVEAYTLETVMERLGHTHLDVLKLDIEGAEFGVIEERSAPIPAGQLALEFHPHLANLEHHRVMLGWNGWERTRRGVDALRASGYELFHVSERGTELSFRRARSEVASGRGGCRPRA